MPNDPDLLIDLASSRFGGRVVEASDEFFGRAERLIEPEAPGSRRDGFDGWETRRRREPGHEWAVVRLGLPGVIRRVVLDTTHATGSHPERISVEAIDLPGDPHLIDLIRRPERWREIVARTPAEPDRRVEMPVGWAESATHVRLVLYPDGAVARLRVLGEPVPAEPLGGDDEIDLVAVANGGIAVDCSDSHYGSPNAALLDERRRSGPGWLTRRRRDDQGDWAVFRLAGAAEVRRLVIDTRRFEGNSPETASVESVFAPAADTEQLRRAAWMPLLPRTPLEADHRHTFSDLEPLGETTHLRLSIYPDGGINRFSAYGTASVGWHRIRRDG
jgi:allantoicase